MRFGFGVAAETDGGRRDQGHGGAAGPGGGDPVTAEHDQDERGADPRGGRGQPVGLRGEGLVPALAFMAVFGQGRMGLGIAVQLVDEAIKQLIGGVEIQLLGIARLVLLEQRAHAAHPRRQLGLVARQLFGQARGIGAGQGAAGETVQQFGEVLQPGFGRRQHILGGAAAQAFEQLVQGVEAGGDAHELAVQTTQAAVAPAHVRVLEHRDAAQAFQAHRFGDEAHVAALERIALAAAAQTVGDEQGEHPEALVQGVAHRRAGGLRQDRGADQGGAENPQGDLQHPPHRRHKGAIRMGQGWQADHCCGVAGKHEAVGAEVAITGGAGRADADPDRQRTEEQFGVLGEQGDQRHHHRRPGQGAEKAVEALGEHLAALRLHDDEHGDHRRARLRQLQTHGQPQGEERGGQDLEDIDPGHAVAARPVEEAPAPFKGVQPAQGCRQGSHGVLLNDQHLGVGSSGQAGSAPPESCSVGSGCPRARPALPPGHRPGPSPVRHGRSGARPGPAAGSAAGGTACPGH